MIKIVNKILKPFRLKISRYENSFSSRQRTTMQQLHDPALSYMHDPILQNQLSEDLSEVAEAHFSNINLKELSSIIPDFKKEVVNFLSCYSKRTIIDNTGGSGFHNAFWLYLLVRIFKPKLFVESGVWKGHTTRLIENAYQNADILGFDLDLSKLEYKSGRSQFFEFDWSEYSFGKHHPDESIVFFDCHVNHAKRIIECKERGFRHLVFDDNPPAHVLYAYGMPGFPTANMVWNGWPNSKKNGDISWFWQGKEISCSFDMDKILEARGLMKKHVVFPNVGSRTKYGGFSFLTYVELNS
ncbi:hypothetical protein QUF75_01420 [Desulfococcaceae bacterium HSG7]|nr:hypothetical protein [Desulfococcaceae bacterium HSG7]